MLCVFFAKVPLVVVSLQYEVLPFSNTSEVFVSHYTHCPQMFKRKLALADEKAPVLGDDIHFKARSRTFACNCYGNNNFLFVCSILFKIIILIGLLFYK